MQAETTPSPATDVTATKFTDILAQYHVTLGEVVCQTGYAGTAVQCALDMDRFDTCPVIVLVQIRVVIEKLLRHRGWQGEGRELWGKFDERLLALLAQHRGHDHRS